MISPVIVIEPLADSTIVVVRYGPAFCADLSALSSTALASPSDCPGDSAAVVAFVATVVFTVSATVASGAAVASGAVVALCASFAIGPYFGGGFDGGAAYT